MRIENVTRGTVLAAHVRTADGAWARFRGLMLRRGLDKGEALDVRGEAAVHTLFMRFPIDAVFYDGEGRIVRIARGLSPWRGLVLGGRASRGVIELAAGSAAGHEPGEQLRWIE